MVRMDDIIWCDGCGVEITWGPVRVRQRRYCCLDCAEGRKCDCGVRMEIVEDSYFGQLAPYETSGEFHHY